MAHAVMHHCSQGWTWKLASRRNMQMSCKCWLMPPASQVSVDRFLVNVWNWGIFSGRDSWTMAWQPESKVQAIEGMLHPAALWLGRFVAGASARHRGLHWHGLRSLVPTWSLPPGPVEETHLVIHVCGSHVHNVQLLPCAGRPHQGNPWWRVGRCANAPARHVPVVTTGFAHPITPWTSWTPGLSAHRRRPFWTGNMIWYDMVWSDLI